MPLRTCGKCGTKVISDDRAEQFMCRNCSTGSIPGPKVAVQESPLPAVTSRTTASAASFNCPSCQSTFASKIPSVASATSCPRCKTALVIHPDGRVETRDAYQQSKDQPAPAATVEAEIEKSDPPSGIMAEAARMVDQTVKAVEALTQDAVQTAREEKNHTTAAKDGKTSTRGPEKSHDTRRITPTSRLSKGKETGRSTQRSVVDLSGTSSSEKSVTYYAVLILAPLAIGFIMLGAKEIGPVGKLFQGLGGRTSSGVRAMAEKLGALRDHRPLAPSEQIPPPAAPANLAVVSVTHSDVTLSWTDMSTNEDGFRIEIGPDGKEFNEILAVPSNYRGATIADLLPETMGYFRVRAVNRGGGSDYSNVVSAKTQKAPKIVQPPPPELTQDEALRQIVDLYNSISRDWRSARHIGIVEPNNPNFLRAKAGLEAKENQLSTKKREFEKKWGRGPLVMEFRKNGNDLDRRIVEWPPHK